MSSSHSSVGMNHAGCSSGPHKPSGTPAEQATMREQRISGATQPRNEHCADRLIHQIPLHDHAQNIQALVNSVSTLLLTSNGDTNGGN